MEIYSSVFGGFQCADCDGPWYLLVIPLYALGVVALIALLFLFNLTISQVTVNGISFYANIMYLYDDHLRQYSVQPFYSIISLLNFKSGFGMCLYNGMDEFTKSMLHFAFPFFLNTFAGCLHHLRTIQV